MSAASYQHQCGGGEESEGGEEETPPKLVPPWNRTAGAGVRARAGPGRSRRCSGRPSCAR